VGRLVTEMTITATGKLLVASLTLVCLTVLMALGTLDPAAGMSPITLIVGFIIGNGNSARKGQTSAPIIGPSPDRIAD
jgi:hypothetical protein